MRGQDVAAAFEYVLIEDDGKGGPAHGQKRMQRLLAQLRSGGMVELTAYRVKNSRVLRANVSTPAGLPARPRLPSLFTASPRSAPVALPAPPPRFTARDARSRCVLAHADPAEMLLHASVLHHAAVLHTPRIIDHAAVLHHASSALFTSSGLDAASSELHHGGPRSFVEVVDADGTKPHSLTRALEHCFGWRGVRLSRDDADRTTLRAVLSAASLGPTADLVALASSVVRPWQFLSAAMESEPAAAAAVMVATRDDRRNDGAAAAGSSRGARLPIEPPLARAVAVGWTGSDRWQRCTACHLSNSSRMRASLYYDRRLTVRRRRRRCCCSHDASVCSTHRCCCCSRS